MASTSTASTKGSEKTESKDGPVHIHTGYFFEDSIGKDVIDALVEKFGSLDTDRPFLMHPNKIGQIIVCIGFTVCLFFFLCFLFVFMCWFWFFFLMLCRKPFRGHSSRHSKMRISLSTGT